MSLCAASCLLWSCVAASNGEGTSPEQHGQKAALTLKGAVIIGSYLLFVSCEGFDPCFQNVIKSNLLLRQLSFRHAWEESSAILSGRARTRTTSWSEFYEAIARLSPVQIDQVHAQLSASGHYEGDGDLSDEIEEILDQYHRGQITAEELYDLLSALYSFAKKDEFCALVSAFQKIYELLSHSTKGVTDEIDAKYLPYVTLNWSLSSLVEVWALRRAVAIVVELLNKRISRKRLQTLVDQLTHLEQKFCLEK